jgi:phosphoribosylanthranilate isomerase
VSVDIKFCGLTRADDAIHATELGARFVGAIFAGGPRNLLARDAARVFAPLPPAVRRVGVFADQDAGEIAATVAEAGLDVIQLHGAWNPARVREIRRAVAGSVWPVVRVGRQDVTAELATAFDVGDGIVVDALVPGRLGGTGSPVPWDAVAATLESVRAGRMLILAGGLRSENVAAAIEILSPDVVDVSSGVESAPGIKDREKMTAFRNAVAGAPTPR